jgi:acyl carrier protein
MIESKVCSVVCSVLRIPMGDPSRIVRAAVPAWDSLKHISIVFAIEDEFSVSFSEDEIAAVASTDDLVRLLHQRGL